MKKRKIWGILLGLVATVALACGIFTACTDGDGDNVYVINVKSLGGMSLSGVSVTAMDGDKQIASLTTDEKGAASFEADPGEYTLTVSNLPKGYFLPEGAGHKTDKNYTPVTIYLESSIIKEAPPANYQYNLGDVMYDFTLTDPDGETTYTLSELLEGKKMVLLNFWDTGCNPCVTEMPGIQGAWEALDSEGNPFTDTVSILAVDVGIMHKDTNADIIDFVENQRLAGNNLRFPMARDTANLTYMFNITSIPVSVVVDRYGVIAFSEIGSKSQREFERLFEYYISDSYVQEDPNPNGGDPSLEWARPDPNLKMPASSVIADAINNGSYDFAYYAEPNPEDAEFAWPWLVNQTEGYIYPSNTGKDLSFAVIYTTLELTSEHIAQGKNVLAFDYRLSSEPDYDVFAVVVNGKSIYEFSGTRYENQWTQCYAVVAERPGTYTLSLIYVKDQQSNGGSLDTVYVRNMRLTTETEINAGIASLDMPSDAVWDYNAGTKKFGGKIEVVKDSDGFYRMKETGVEADKSYFVFANLMEATNFNVSLGNDWSVAQYAISGYFNYNDTDDPEDPDYDPKKDFTDRIGNYARAANNSVLYPLVVVTDELKDLLNRFALELKGSDDNGTAWLEFCIYFRHFGYDASDTGFNTPKSNPSLGLMFEMAFETAPVIQKDGTATEENYNLVKYDRMIVPLGLYYKFQPSESGVYRVETQSQRGVDTMAWIYLNDGSVNGKILLETGMQLEHAAEDYNCVMTYYFDKDTTYYIAMAPMDMGAASEGAVTFTFTIRAMGDSYFSWQHMQREYSTFDENYGYDSFVMLRSVMPVAYNHGTEEEPDIRYYNAMKNPDGTYYRKPDTQDYLPNLQDPLYVDFVNGTHFDPRTSLQAALAMGEVDGDRGVLRRVQQYFAWNFERESLRDPTTNQFVMSAAKPYNGAKTVNDLVTEGGLLKDEGGNVRAATAAEREAFIRSIYVSYGGDMLIYNPEYNYTDDAITYLSDASRTLLEIAEYMSTHNLRAFGDDTDDMNKVYLQKALHGEKKDDVFPVPSYVKGQHTAGHDVYPASAGAPYAGNTRTMGTVHLTQALKDALFRFAYGILEDGEEYGRLCSHYEFLGSYEDYLDWAGYERLQNGTLRPKTN